MLIDTESSSDLLMEAAAQLVANAELPDWYVRLSHLVEDNCRRHLKGLDYLLDRGDWLVARPQVTLWTRRNQLGNVYVTWEPTLLHTALADELREFGEQLLNDCYHRRNEFMYIKQAAHIGPSDDDRVLRAASLLCSALVARHGELAAILRAPFDLTIAGRLRAATERQPMGNGLLIEG